MLALANVLQQRGHMVRLAAPPDFEGWVLAHGIEFAPLGTPIKPYLEAHPELLTGNPRTSLQSALHYFNDQMPVVARGIEMASSDADLIVWAGLAFVAPTIAEYLGRPSVAVMYSPCMLPFSTDQHPPPSIPWQTLPPWLNRLLWAINGSLTGRVIDRVHNGIRRQLALEPVEIRQFLQTACSYYVAADPTLFPTDRAWGERVIPGNFIFYQDTRPLDPSLQAWLDDGEPPVFVGFGSMSGKATKRIEEVIRDALQAIGRRGLVGAGWAGLGQSRLPADWRIVHDVSHQTLFAQVAAVIHHGGSGTTANALRAGVPQVIVPLILDQYHHAYRLYMAGLMPKPVSMEKTKSSQLAHALQVVMTSPAEPRQEIALRLGRSDSCGDLAQHLEGLTRGAGRARP